jgi:hypothetical protein
MFQKSPAFPEKRFAQVGAILAETKRSGVTTAIEWVEAQ